MRIASWNVNSLRVRLPHVLEWLGSAQPDVLAIQETKTRDPDFPVAAFRDAGFNVTFAGQPTYNGVAVLARQPQADIVTEIADFPDDQRRVLAVTIAGVRVVNLYVPNGQSVDSDKYQYKLGWLQALTAQVRRELSEYEHCVVLGDFNIAPDDRDVHDPEGWRDKILCSQPERRALQNLLDLGLTDTFRSRTEEGGHFSWWDYRAAGFRRNLGLRIDLILASAGLQQRLEQALIDAEPRRWDRPSDHTPVIADFRD